MSPQIPPARGAGCRARPSERIRKNTAARLPAPSTRKPLQGMIIAHRRPCPAAAQHTLDPAVPRMDTGQPWTGRGQHSTNEYATLCAADGHRFSAYAARPEGKPIAELVVIQEIFGFTAQIAEQTAAISSPPPPASCELFAPHGQQIPYAVGKVKTPAAGKLKSRNNNGPAGGDNGRFSGL